MFILNELIYANLCKKYIFDYKSQNKAPKFCYFGKHILFNIHNNNINANVWFRNYFLYFILFFLVFLSFFLLFLREICHNFLETYHAQEN